MMNFFVSVFCIIVCVISGYSGGFFLDKQMKATNASFTLIVVPKLLRRFFLFYNLYPCKAILEGLILETSGILSSLLILAFSVIFPLLHAPFILLIMVLHCVVLIIVGCIAYIKYLRSMRRVKNYRGPLKCQFLKLFSGKPVISLVEVMEVPADRSDGQYIVRYGRNKSYIAKSISKYSYESGRHYNAIYRDVFPHFILLPPSDSEN